MSKPVRFPLWTGNNKRQLLDEDHTFGAGSQAGGKPICVCAQSLSRV